MLVGTYSGQGASYLNPATGRLVSGRSRESNTRFLHGEVDVLVCTDAAAEGLNLQTANLIINFDLPWNPMKVEQRIGRLDRIGQTHDEIYVLNLCYQGSVEEIVYERLLRRLEEAQLIVGTQQFSMLPVTSDEFRALADGLISEAELLSLATHRAKEQRERSRSMEIPAEELYRIYNRLEMMAASSPAPITLEAIWQALTESAHLQELGSQLQEVQGEEVLLISGVEGVQDRTPITVSRRLYEEGLPDGTAPHFASYGDPVFGALLDHFAEYELPESAIRLSLKAEDFDTETVGFAVPTAGPDGRSTKVVCSWEDLAGLDINNTSSLAEGSVSEAEAELTQRTVDALQVARAVPKIERDNLRAGKAQLSFGIMVAMHVLERWAGDNFWSTVEEMEAQLGGSEPVNVAGLPAEWMRSIENELLFDVKVPKSGQSASVIAWPILMRSALGAAKRQADGLKNSQVAAHCRASLGTHEAAARARTGGV